MSTPLSQASSLSARSEPEEHHIIAENVPEPARSLASNVALITGASLGIRAAVARAFSEAGAAVVLASRDRSSLDARAAELEALGGKRSP